MAHRNEHLTGLILPTSTSTGGSNNDVVIAGTSASSSTTATPPSGPIAPPAVIKALRSLRDSNPSLLRKMNHGITVGSNETSTTVDDDESLSYWNRHQEMVTILKCDDDNESSSIGINLGGMMVRLVDVVPFFRIVNEEKLSLRTVNFGGSDVGMDNLLEGIQLLSNDNNTQTSSIVGLYLSGCGIGCRKGTRHLIRILELLPNLETLDLRYNNLEGNDMIHLFSEESSVSSHPATMMLSNLKILHLEGNVMKCTGAMAIGKLLASSSKQRNNTNLKELYLGANQIGSEGAVSIAEGLRDNSHLEKLYLEGNCIGDVGAIALRDVLLDRRSRGCTVVLEHLYVDNNGIGKEAGTSLGRALNSESMIEGSLFDAGDGT